MAYGRKYKRSSPLRRPARAPVDWKRFRKQWYRGWAGNPDTAGPSKGRAPPTPPKTYGKRPGSGSAAGVADVKKMKMAVSKSTTRRGFVAGRQRVGRVSKGRRGGSKLLKYQMKGGLNHTSEYNGVVTGSDVVWIGHHTFPAWMLYRQGVKLLFKTFMKLCGTEIVAQDQQIPWVPPGGFVMVVEYRISPVATSATVNFPMNDTTTMNDFVNWFTNVARPFNNNAPSNLQSQILRVWIDPANTSSGGRPTAMLDVTNLIVKFHTVSTFKMQNRTKNADGVNDSTDESDVVPCIGKSYQARGNELKLKRPTDSLTVSAPASANFVIGDNYYGMMGNSVIVAQNSMQEPPQGKVEFTNCRTVGSVSIGPGDIKISTLKDSESMYFNTLLRLNYPFISAGSIVPTQKRGVSRTFCIEKLINTFNATAYPVTIAYEHNFEVSGFAYVKRQFSTIKSFEKANAP